MFFFLFGWQTYRKRDSVILAGGFDRAAVKKDDFSGDRGQAGTRIR